MRSGMMQTKTCKHEHIHTERTTLTLAAGPGPVVLYDVPVHVCDDCGERFVSPKNAHEIIELADLAANEEF